jgi:hypothetical protein
VRRLLPSVLAIGALVAILAAGRASAAPDWLAPSTLSAPSPDATDPDIALDPQGNALAIWRRDAGSSQIVEVAGRLGGDPWAMPQGLAGPGEPAEAPRIALDAGGGAVAVWEGYDAGHYVIQATQRPAGGSWSAAQRLSSITQNAYRPQVAVDAGGNAVAVWESYESGYHVVQAARRSPDGGWSAPQRLSPLAELAGAPQVAVGAAGEAVAVWTSLQGGNFAVEAAQGSADGSWSAPQDLAIGGQPGGPQIAIDPGGDAVAVWETTEAGHFVIQASQRQVGGSWSAPQTLSTPAEPAEAPQVAVDAAGSALVVWQSYVGGYFIVQGVQRPVGGDWSGVEDLSDRYLAAQYQSARQPQVGVDPRGDAVVVWQSYEGSYYVIQATQRPAGGGWSAVQNISTANQDADAPQVAVDPEGDAVAVWESAEGAGRTIQAAAYDTTGPQLRRLSVPAGGVAGEALPFSVSAVDLWSKTRSTVWSFGDGATALGDSVQHRYDRAGTYTVTVTSTDVSGNASSASATVSVRRAPRGIALAARRVPVKRGRALLRLRCPDGGGCLGVAKLVAGMRPVGTAGPRPNHRIRLGRARFSIPGGRATVVRVRLTHRAVALLTGAERRRLAVLLRGSGLRHGRVTLEPARRRAERRTGG